MEPRLIQQQSQKLILSPQIRQYLRLLQLPITDLQQAVEMEIEVNPLLEEKIADLPEEPSEDGQAEEAPVNKDTRELTPGESFEAFDRVDESFLETYDSLDSARSDPKDLEAKRQFQETLVTRPEALSDFLMWQIRFIELSETQKKIAAEIIGNIDDDGYLRATPEEIAQSTSARLPDIEEVLTKIHQLDPPGIGARDLQEALAIQIQKKIAEYPAGEDDHTTKQNLEVLALALEIITKHLNLLEKRDWVALGRLLQRDVEAIKKAAAVIARLDPKPGRGFLTEESLVVVPDASISINEDQDDEGKFRIEIHDERIPDIRISPYYRKLLRGKDLDEKSKTFLKEKLQAALNFMQAVRLRKSTIREITEEIVKAQAEFLEKGFAHLKPLRLKDIAGNLGIHESTVSRAIQAKYVSTPQGLIPYKSFFSTALETSDGSSESQKSIMEKLKKMIEKESPEKPLSDQDIVKMMKEEGVVIARRTVAKYRDLMRILPSHMRRKK